MPDSAQVMLGSSLAMRGAARHESLVQGSFLYRPVQSQTDGFPKHLCGRSRFGPQRAETKASIPPLLLNNCSPVRLHRASSLASFPSVRFFKAFLFTVSLVNIHEIALIFARSSTWLPQRHLRGCKPSAILLLVGSEFSDSRSSDGRNLKNGPMGSPSENPEKR